MLSYDENKNMLIEFRDAMMKLRICLCIEFYDAMVKLEIHVCLCLFL